MHAESPTARFLMDSHPRRPGDRGRSANEDAPIRFSLRTLLIVATLSIGLVAIYRYLWPSPTIEDRLDTSFTSHAIFEYPEVGRFGFHSDVLLAISNSTPKSLRSPRIVGAWVRPDSHQLFVLFLASSFSIDGVRLRDSNGEFTSIPVPSDVIEYNRYKATHSIDFQIVVPLNSQQSTKLESVALLREKNAESDFFNIRRLPAQIEAEP